MKSFVKKHIPFLVMTLLLLLMIVFLVVINILKQNPNIAEQWTRGFGRAYTSFFGVANQAVPFSLTEVSFLVSIISCVVFLAWGFCLIGLKQYWAAIHRFLMVALVITGTLTMYSASVGMAYTRKALPIEKYEGEVNKEELKDIATYFVNDLNKCANQLKFDENGEVIMPYSKETLLYKLRDEFKRLPDNGYYSKYVPLAKELRTSGIFTSVGIVGVYFGVLGEANYNSYSTNAELPFYAIHELAHGTGVMREDDAQLVATYLCLTSEDYYLRYSCYYNTIDRIMNLVTYSDNPNDYNDVKKLINDKVWKNYSYIYNHWKGKCFIQELGDKINDWYLKSFGQKGGTSSYIDTDTEVDEKTKKIYLSQYQHIYVKYYYDLKNK